MSGDSGTVLALGSDIGQPYEVFVSVTIDARPAAADSLTDGAGEYEAALVQIHGESGSYRCSSTNFDFVDTSGRHYPPIGGTSADRFGSVLGSGTVTAGQNVEGYIVFEVPSGGGVVELKDALGRPMQWRTRE